MIVHTNCRNPDGKIPHICLYILEYTNDTIKSSKTKIRTTI